MTQEPDIKRWTAKLKAELIKQIYRGQTTVPEAARRYDLTQGMVHRVWMLYSTDPGFRPRAAVSRPVTKFEPTFQACAISGKVYLLPRTSRTGIAYTS